MKINVDVLESKLNYSDGGRYEGGAKYASKLVYDSMDFYLHTTLDDKDIPRVINFLKALGILEEEHNKL